MINNIFMTGAKTIPKEWQSLAAQTIPPNEDNYL
jgi:hypothetical protein